MYQPIQNGRLYEQIVAQIEQQILSGHLRAGDRLPPERELAGQFNVSRTAVREAVKALRQKGLLEVYPGRGTFVMNQTSQALQSSLGLAMRIGQPDGGVDDLIELREMIEPAIVAKAAARASAEQIAAMEVLVARMDEVLELPEEFIAADFQFHQKLAEASQNALMPTILDSIVDLLQVQRKRIFKAGGGQRRAQRNHHLILRAIKARDPFGAQQAMTTHLMQVREDFESAEDTLESDL